MPEGELYPVARAHKQAGGRSASGKAPYPVQANACLIAATPRMYEAGRAMAEVIRDLYEGEDVTDARLHDLYDGWLAATEQIDDSEDS